MKTVCNLVALMGYLLAEKLVAQMAVYWAERMVCQMVQMLEYRMAGMMVCKSVVTLAVKLVVLMEF